MAETVDTIQSLLVADVDKYIADMNAARQAFDKWKASVTGKMNVTAPGDAAEAQKKTSEKVIASVKQEAAAVVASEKAKTDAVDKFAKAAESAAKKVADAEAKAAARAATASETEKRRSAERIDRLRAEERAATNQAKASAFLSGTPSGKSARESASIFQADFKAADAAEKAEAKRVATAEVASTKIVEARNKEAAGTAVAAEAEEAALTRLSAVAERAAARRGVPIGSGANIGATVPRGGSALAPSSAPAAQAEIAQEKEVNYLLRDRIDLQTAIVGATGKERDIIKDQILELKLIDQYRRAGLTEVDAAIRAEERLAVVQAGRAKAVTNGKSGIGIAAQTAAFGYSPATSSALFGLAGAAAVGVGVVAIKSAVDYGTALSNVSDQLGLTTTNLQVYQAAALRSGATQEQFNSALSIFNSNLGKAQQGSREQAKIFDALGISLKGVKSAGDILPTIIDRLSSIADPATRASVGTRLFGEEYRRLDGFLSGGNEKINGFAAALERTGSILSSDEIRRLKSVGDDVAKLQAELQVQLSTVVAANADSIRSLANAFGDLVNGIGDLVRAYQALKGSGFGQFVSSINSAAIQASPLGIVSRAIGAARNIIGRIASGPSDGSIDVPLGDVQGGGVNQGLINHLGDPQGKSAQALAKEAAQRNRRFAADEQALQKERLDVLSQLTADTRVQDEYQRQEIRAAQSAKDEELKQQAIANIASGESAKEANARRDILIALNDENADLQIKAVNRKETSRAIQESLEASKTQAGIDSELLSDTQALAKTQAERRAIGEKLLQIAEQQQRNELQAILDDPNASPQAKANAQTKSDALPGLIAGKRASLNQSTRGPLQTFLDDLPSTASQVNEALQNVEVDGLKSLTDGLTDAILHVHNLGDAFKSVANQIIADLIRIGVERAIVGPLADALFGKKSGGGGGGVISAIGSGISSLFGGARAGGGPVAAGTLYKVNENGTEGFRPTGSGQIIPLGPMATQGGGDTYISQSFTLDARGGITTPDLLRYVNTTAAQARAQGAELGYKRAVEATPGRLAREQSLGTS